MGRMDGMRRIDRKVTLVALRSFLLRMIGFEDV